MAFKAPIQQPPSAQRLPLANNGQTDQQQILQIMEQVVQDHSNDAIVRETTVSILRGVGNNDVPNQVKMVADWVRKSVTYVRDPVDGEYIITPDRMLQNWAQYGYMAGDCDDHVVLLNAMLGSIGVPTKAIGVKFGGSKEFNHVISGAVVNGVMHQIDPCAKSGNLKVYQETLMI